MGIPLCVICCFSLAAFNICSLCLIFVNLINMCLGVFCLGQQLELDMEQQTGSKQEKEYVKAVYCPCLFNLYAEYIMRKAGLDEAQTGIKIARRNISNFRYGDDTTLMAESKEGLKSLLMKVKKLA